MESITTHYLGHGSTYGWGQVPQVLNEMLSALSNGDLRQPLLLSMGCNTGFFASPIIPVSLMEQFMLTEGGGAIACWSPAHVSSVTEDTSLSTKLFENFFDDYQTLLGPLTTESKIQAYVNGDVDLIALQTIATFGDPALRLKTYDPAQDGDGDGVRDNEDNCSSTTNPGQRDVDADAVGNACDNCPNLSNPSQEDLDHDGIGDSCDPVVDDTDIDLAGDGGDGGCGCSVLKDPALAETPLGTTLLLLGIFGLWMIFRRRPKR